MPLKGALPRRGPLELPLSPTLELLPELLEPDEPPEDEDDPEDDEPDGEAGLVDTPAGAECCAFAAGAAPTAMTPMRPAARRYRFMPSSTL